MQSPQQRTGLPAPGAERRALPGRGLDAGAVRAWCARALDALGRAREEIDAINVYPVADGDTGTNLYLTLESAARAVEAAFEGLAPRQPTLAQTARAMAHGALIGSRGNSGTILAQLLRGLAEVLSGTDSGTDSGTEQPGTGSGAAAGDGVIGGAAGTAGTGASDGAADAAVLRRALRRAAEGAYEAVARPVEGTVLTVATAAADAADASDAAEGDCGAVACAAYDGACGALRATPGQLAVLGRAGVVDAGGQGLVVLLAALAETLTGATVAVPAARTADGTSASSAPSSYEPAAACPALRTPPADGTDDSEGADRTDTDRADRADRAEGAEGAEGREGAQEPEFEVIYLLEADTAAVDRLRVRLDGLGDSLVVGGGDGLWSIHVHVDDAGAAVEAGVEAGRPYRIRITHFTSAAGPPRPVPPAEDTRTAAEPARRAVVAAVPGDGIGALYAEAGATIVPVRPGEPPASGELVAALRRAHGCGAGRVDGVILLPNDDALRHAAAAAAEQVRAEGIRAAVIPTRAAVQGLAALAVHEPRRRFDEDVVAMTSAAGATRYAELTVAEREAWTTAGVCQAGDVLGLIDGDVAVIGDDPSATALTVLDRMLSAGGELVTLITADAAPAGLATALEDHVRGRHLAVDTVAYPGGGQHALLLIGVE